MQTIKTAVVVVLLLFVLYGGYVALNGTDTQLAEELESLVSLDETTADVSGPSEFQPAKIEAEGTGGSDPFARFASQPSPNFSNASTPPPPAMLPLPSPGGNASTMIPSPTTPSPTILELDLPELEVPKPASPESLLPNLPALPLTPNPNDASNTGASSDRRIPVSNVSSKSEPGFGLALPNSKPSEVGLLPKMPSTTATSVPALDLPALHGDAKSLAESTAMRTDSSASSTQPGIPNSKSTRSYENAKQLAMDHIHDGKLKEALAVLSVFYNAQELTSTQRSDLIDLLDALAREVIYSRRHLMDFPYVIAPGETLEQVAKQYNVPAEVLARINGLELTGEVPPSTKLKLVPGPFRAEVDLNRNELTMFVGDLYAGRYPASFGAEQPAKPGVYQVLEKQRNRNYYSSNGMQISAEDPDNPYGGFWIDLGQDVCIHGSPNAEGNPANLGCISLSPLDASDVFGMLASGSQVTIRR